ncbi:MAG: LamG-like jellyroll fold domain-containing protein, partial [Patescibacteria group bacterium]
MKLLKKKNIFLAIRILLYSCILVFLYFYVSPVFAQDFGLNEAAGIGLAQIDLKTAIVRIIQIILGFLGLVAVIIILYGGYVYLTAAGDPAKTEKARKILINAVIGLLIILSAFAIVWFVANIFGPPPPHEPCSPVDATSACGLNGCGVRTCEADGFWGDCDTSGCPEPIPFARKFSYVSGFKSDSLNHWSRDIYQNYPEIVSVPAIDDLKARGYARNQGNTINSMELFTKPDGGTFSSTGFFADVPIDQEVVSNVYAGWDTSPFAPESIFWDKIKVSIPGLSPSFESAELKIKIRPAHCFNGVRDQGESEVDCGDGCGACPGDPCGDNPDVCVNNCANDVCITATCRCAYLPEITEISPADGAPGNYITIWGRNFGSTQGFVEFIDSSGNITYANLDLIEQCGGANWTNGQIIAAVPAVDLADYDVKVVTAQSLNSNTKNFTVNNIDRPGICRAVPDRGTGTDPFTFPDTTNVYGIKFPTAAPQNNIWYFRFYDETTRTSSDDNATSTAAIWTNQNQMIDTVPQNKTGNSSIRIYNGSQSSNYYRMVISAGGLGESCGYQDTTTTCSAASVCQPGLLCSYDDDCTCRWAPNTCGDNRLSEDEDCDKVGGVYRFQPRNPAVKDFSGNIDGNVHGASLTGGKIGEAYQFDDVNDYIDLGRDITTGLLDELTICAWVKRAAVGYGDIKYFDGIIGSYWWDNWLTWRIEGNTLPYGSIMTRFYYEDGSRTGEIEEGSSVDSISDTNWHHICLSYKKGDKIRHYLDGNLTVEVPAQNKRLSLPTTRSVYIGAVGQGNYFNGLIDEVRIYNRALDPSEITPDAMTSNGLVNYYSFSESRGKDQCADYDLGAGAVTCQSDCHLNTSACSNGPVLAQPATQSIYTWAFRTIIGGYFNEPFVIEDCSRSRDCREGQKLPSPTPWSEGWNQTITPNLYIQNEKACVNAIISARFNVQMDPATLNNDNIMDPATLNNDNIIVLRCSNISIPSIDPVTLVITYSITRLCTLVPGSITVNSDNNEKENDYFVFTPSERLTPGGDGSFYKVILRKEIKSFINIPLREETQKVAERDCNVGYYDINKPSNPDGSVNNVYISDAAYCWNFETRTDDDPALVCPEGCVECSPDPARMYFYGDTTNYNANLDSADNVCLMLNPWTYSWDWESDKTDKVVVYAVPPTAPKATSTAIGETIFDEPNPYAKVTASLSSGKNDFCRTYNDFTNPIVMEEAACDNTPQSPSPWLNSSNNCRNAMISARFSRPMVGGWTNADGTINNGTLNKNNIILQKCTIDITPPDMGIDCEDDNLINDDNQIKIFDYSHEVTPERLRQEEFDNLSGPLPEGFYVFPCNDLDANSLYRVIIRGGNGGVRGAKLVTTPDGSIVESTNPDTGEEIKEGVLLTPTIDNWDYNNDGEDDYFWTFSTGSQVCQPEQVQVAPRDKFMRLVGDTQEYNAFVQAANCNLLNPLLIEWNPWRSLLDLDAAGEGAPGDSIATVTNETNEQRGNTEICRRGSWSGSDIGDNIAPTQTATGVGEGTTYIRAKEPQGRWDAGWLQVGLGDYLRITRYQPRGEVACRNELIQLDFNMDVKTNSIRPNDNVKLYECASAECPISSATRRDISIFGTLPELTNEVVFTPTLQASTAYRVLVMGGSDGPKAWNDKELSGQSLNFNSSGAAKAGEECEPGIYPWNYPAGNTVCNNSCLLTGDLCGTRFAQCGTNYQNVSSYYYYPFSAGSPPLPANNDEKPVLKSGGDCKNGNCYEFNGADDYIELLSRTDSVNVMGGSFTLSAWARPTNDAGGYKMIVGKWGYHMGLMYNGYGAERNKFIFMLFDNLSTSNQYRAVSSRTYGLNEWHYVTGTYNKNNYQARLYVDGELVGSVQLPNGSIIRPVNTPIRAGIGIIESDNATDINGDRIHYDLPFKGTIDEVTIFKGNLTDSEVKSLYESNGVPPPPPAETCDSTCHNLGNTNRASCGNGVVESTEECDDRNTTDGDGCSKNCLLEGSNARYDSRCGNGRIEQGESCDDGNTRSSDGCSDICLVESLSPRPGSAPNVSVCGNGTVEEGESCDDGNITAEDGCGASCLNEGSSGGADCGNGVVESGQLDSFSWTFRTGDLAGGEVCSPVTISIPPCPNGIWRVGFFENITNATVYIQQATPDSDPAFNSATCQDQVAYKNFWQKTLAVIKSFALKLIGREAGAASYWCPISTIDYNFSSLSPLNHHQDQDGFEIIGYRDEYNRYILSYIKDTSWTQNEEYRIKVDYSMGGGESSISQSVVINRDYCAIDEIITNVWPIGEEKNQDNFFCDRDDCGQNSSDPYLQDQDAASGNQHLYRAWGINDTITAGKEYYLRPMDKYDNNFFVYNPDELKWTDQTGSQVSLGLPADF